MAIIKEIPNVPEPPRLDRRLGLGRLVENSMVRFFAQIFNRAKDSVAELIRSALERLLESLERPLAAMVGGMLDDVLDVPGLPLHVRKILLETRNPTHPVAIVGLIAAVGSLVVMLIPAALSGVTEKVRQISHFVARPFLLDFGTWRAASLRNPSLKLEMENDLKGWGWRDDQIAAARLASETRLGLSEILTAFVRGELSSAMAKVRLRHHGVAEQDLEILLELSQQIPGAGDLVRFALREAWDDGVAAKYGYDSGMSADFVAWMEKQGLGGEWPQAFWRSHWVVPSAGQGFEMMHRGVISEAELVELLKINDLAPGWIPQMLQIARPTPGRVDRRWAFEEGEISESELYELYRSDGYDDRWAAILSATVVKRSVSEAKGLTRAAIVAAYKKKRLSSAESVALLEDVGIAANVAHFYLGQADDDHADALLDRRVDVVGKQFSLGDMSESQARDALGALGVGSAEVAVYLEEWSIARGTKIRRPSRANLDKFFRDGVINISAYREQMDRLGYSTLYVDWYLAALAIERQELTEKEERAVHVEAERLAKDRKKSAYQLAKSKLDVNIAELNAAIASAQVALIEAQNERAQRLSHALPAAQIAALEREYQPLLFDAEAAISEARLQITRLQTSIKEKRESISLVDRSLVENVDMMFFAELKATRLQSQTEQARLGEMIAANRVVIAQLKEAIAAFEDVAEIDAAKAHILALQTEIAQYAEQQAFHLTRIRELDEQMSVALSATRRSDLQTEKAAFSAEISSIEREIAHLREEVQSVQSERESLGRELETQITALPGSEIQIAIRSSFLTRIGEIESNIKEYRENVAMLRLEKSRLNVEWRK